MSIPVHTLSVPTPLQGTNETQLRKVACELEVTFLSEMLKYSGLGQTRESFGGGVGEDQFASLLINEQARAVVDAGGIGLAETIFQSLKEKANG